MKEIIKRKGEVEFALRADSLFTIQPQGGGKYLSISTLPLSNQKISTRQWYQ